MTPREGYYPSDGYLPNWPKPETITIERLAKFCTPVQQAIIDGLTKQKKTKLKEKYLSSQRDSITPDELDQIRKAYALQTDLILMLAEMQD